MTGDALAKASVPELAATDTAKLDRDSPGTLDMEVKTLTLLSQGRNQKSNLKPDDLDKGRRQGSEECLS